MCFDANVYGIDEISKARELQEQNRHLATLPESLIVAIGRQWSQAPQIAMANDDDVIDRDSEMERLRQETQKLVGKISAKRFGYANGGHAEIHTELNKAAGIRKSVPPTLAQWRRKYELAKECLARLSRAA